MRGHTLHIIEGHATVKPHLNVGHWEDLGREDRLQGPRGVDAVKLGLIKGLPWDSTKSTVNACMPHFKQNTNAHKRTKTDRSGPQIKFSAIHSV